MRSRQAAIPYDCVFEDSILSSVSCVAGGRGMSRLLQDKCLAVDEHFQSEIEAGVGIQVV
jgi:hypothetical protein